MLIHPAYLYTGPAETVKQQAELFIQQVLCTAQGCAQCLVCLQIKSRQHYLVRWLSSDTGYTLAALESIFKTILYVLGPDEHFFFVLERADTLSLVCASKLLKSLEEPPVGYHFMLLASCKEAVLPTLRSRCVVYNYTSEFVQEHPLVDYFINFQVSRAILFAKELELLKVTEHDYALVLDALQSYILQEYKKAVTLQDTAQVILLEKKQALLEQARAMPPMPGSAKLFFKNLFLRFLVLS